MKSSAYTIVINRAVEKRQVMYCVSTIERPTASIARRFGVLGTKSMLWSGVEMFDADVKDIVTGLWLEM